MKANA